MRVALLSTFHETCGIATYAEALVQALTTEGADVSVLAPRLRASDVGRGEQPPRLWNRNRAFGFEAKRVVQEIVSRSPDVVHLQVNRSLFSSRFMFELARRCHRAGLPLVATLHGRMSGSLGPDFKLWRLLIGLRRAELIVHTDQHRAELARDRVHVIAHGVDPAKPADRQRARARLGIERDRRVIAHFGFLTDDKGIAEVMRAVAELRRRGQSELLYWISGAIYTSRESRAHFERLRALVTELSLEGSVHLTGEFVGDDQMLAELQAADWIVLNYKTGTSQGASGAARRALSSGRPVAVSSAAVFDDLRGAVHTLTPPLAPALEALLADDALAARTIEKARAYCEENSWPRVARRHLDLYRSLSRRGDVSRAAHP